MGIFQKLLKLRSYCISFMEKRNSCSWTNKLIKLNRWKSLWVYINVLNSNIKIYLLSGCNKTYYGDIGRTYELELHRPREDLVPHVCLLTITAAGGIHGDLVQVCIITTSHSYTHNDWNHYISKTFIK